MERNSTAPNKQIDYFNPKTGHRYRIGGCKMSSRPSTAAQFSASAKYMGKQLPASVDLRQDMTPVEKQEETSSCVGNALAAAYEFLILKNTRKHIDVSRLFIYFNARIKDGLKEYNMIDDGTTIPNAIEALAEFGCCKEQSFPFEDRNVNRPPPAHCYEEAKHYRIKEGMQLTGNLNEMKSCLTQGYPFAFGLQLFESFHDAATNGGRVPMPNLDEDSEDKYQGGHALLAAGYSDRSQCFIVKNSWGENWGDKGYCYIPYQYMSTPELCTDLHAIKIITNDAGHRGTQGTEHETGEQRFWKPNDSHDYYHSIWHDKSVEQTSLSGSPPMCHILWMDHEKPEIGSMTRHLGSDPRVHITFQDSFDQAVNYLSQNAENIRSLPRSSIFQIICRGYYASENKNAFDLLPILRQLHLQYIPIIVVTGHKPDVLNHFKRQAQATGIQEWRARIYVPSSQADLITRINANLLNKYSHQRN